MGTSATAQYSGTPPTNQSNLPFTGFNDVGFAVAGLILVMAGALMRYRARNPQQQTQQRGR